MRLFCVAVSVVVAAGLSAGPVFAAGNGAKGSASGTGWTFDSSMA